jgi:hypothetical protein
MLSVLRGVSEERALVEIRRAVYPARTRAWLGLRSIFVPPAESSADQELARNLAACTSSREIEEVLFNYRNDPTRISLLERRLLGQPRLKRALVFYGRLKDEWRGRGCG